MRFLLKLILAGVAIAALMPFLGPDTSVGRVVRAALDDAAGFCERQPEACASGATIARDAGDLIADTIASLKGEATALTETDRAIVPDQTIPPRAHGQPADAFAGHGSAVRD